MLRYFIGFLALTTTIFFFSACKKSTTHASDEDSFWLTGTIQKYQGNFVTIDSTIVGTDSLGFFICEYGSTSTQTREYLVKHQNDTIFTTFNKDAGNTSSILTNNRLDSLGWYNIDEFNHFKFNQDTLWVKGDFIVPAYANNGTMVKRATRFEGHLEN